MGILIKNGKVLIGNGNVILGDADSVCCCSPVFPDLCNFTDSPPFWGTIPFMQGWATNLDSDPHSFTNEGFGSRPSSTFSLKTGYTQTKRNSYFVIDAINSGFNFTTVLSQAKYLRIDPENVELIRFTVSNTLNPINSASFAAPTTTTPWWATSSLGPTYYEQDFWLHHTVRYFVNDNNRRPVDGPWPWYPAILGGDYKSDSWQGGAYAPASSPPGGPFTFNQPAIVGFRSYESALAQSSYTIEMKPLSFSSGVWTFEVTEPAKAGAGGVWPWENAGTTTTTNKTFGVIGGKNCMVIDFQLYHIKTFDIKYNRNVGLIDFDNGEWFPMGLTTTIPASFCTMSAEVIPKW